VRRREFITLLGGGAAAWPLAASAQQAERVRRIGVLAHVAESDPVYQGWVASFRDALAKLGWIEGRDLRINYRWAGDDAGKLPAYAAELVALAPDALFAIQSGPVAFLQQATRTVPIVFAQVGDPIAFGFVSSLARPGGNITGFAETGIAQADCVPRRSRRLHVMIRRPRHRPDTFPRPRPRLHRLG
jgi:putative ABC transport system substrate-binding protein